MKKVSQQIASVFLIIDAMFLIPMVLIGILFIIPIFLYGGLIALGSILSGKHILYGVSFFSIFLIMFGSFIFGCHLMKGYYKHVLGKLGKCKK